jgi:hypothetical protein
VRRLLIPFLASTALAAPAPAATAAETEVRPCRERVEVNRPITRLAGPDDVTLGRMAFTGLRRYADPDEFAKTYNPHRKAYGIKSGVGVRANRNVKLSIAPAQRAVAGLGYDSRHRLAEPGVVSSVRLQPCPPRTRAFSYVGTVGRITAFSGGLAVTEPMCLVLEARVRGRDPVRRAISLGMGDSCVQHGSGATSSSARR